MLRKQTEYYTYYWWSISSGMRARKLWRMNSFQDVLLGNTTSMVVIIARVANMSSSVILTKISF